MEKKERKFTKWLYWFAFAVAVILVYKTVDSIGAIGGWIGNLLKIISPFLVGTLIAYILYIPCRRVERWYEKIKIKMISKRARGLSVISVYIIVLLILIILVTYIIPPIMASLTDLITNFQTYYNEAIERANSLPEDSFLRRPEITEIIEKIKTIDLKQFVSTERLIEYAQGAMSMVSGVVNFFVTLIVSVYVLLARREIVKFIKRAISAIFNEKVAGTINKYFNKTNEIFFNFLAGQLIDAVVVAVITSIAMLILDVKYAILLGFMIGLLNLIPYFGAIIGVVIAAVITLITGGWEQALWMVVIVTILQQIDANIINPKILGNSVQMNPLLVIISVTIGGAYFGVLGIFLAVPTCAVVKIVIEDVIEYKLNKKKIKAEI